VAAAQQITQAGSVVGSLAYMAPEQFLGEQLDARADLFSLGVVLFECLTGHHPFRGADGADTRRRILAGEVAEIEPGLDDEVGAVLARMLAPDREDRYPSVAPLLREIQALVVGAGGARLPDSIAVLPFTDRDGGDWSGAALADGLRRALQRVDGVQVVPRGQIAALCAAHGSVPIAVGFAAACRWVISGQIQREAGRWEVSAELLNVATDSVAAWSEAIADDLAPAARGLGDRIVESIGLIGDPLHGPLAPSDVVARAMELAWRKVGRRDFREAIGLLEEVLRLEPDHVEALVQFGEIAGLLHSSTGDPVLSTAARTRLERAVELDPDNPRANQWLGYNLSAHGELIDAEQHFAAARTADPGNWQHDYFHAGSLMALPLHAIPEIAARRGVRDLVDPVSWRRSAALAERLRLLGAGGDPVRDRRLRRVDRRVRARRRARGGLTARDRRDRGVPRRGASTRRAPRSSAGSRAGGPRDHRAKRPHVPGPVSLGRAVRAGANAPRSRRPRSGAGVVRAGAAATRGAPRSALGR
jgi:TolB-like protein